MRSRVLLAVTASVAAALLTACSLIVSTSGLSSPGEPAPGAAGGGDGAVPLGDGAVGTSDAGTDADAGAARDPHLVAEYSFEDPAGTMALDTSGNLRHALLNGDATFVADGVRGRALSFGGTGFLVVDALAGNVYFPASGTLSVWFRYSFPLTASADQRSIFDSYDRSRNHLFIRRANGDTGTVFQAAAQSTQAATMYAFESSFDVPQNTWSHCVLTWDAATASAAFYLDGKVVGASPYTLKFSLEGQLFRMGDNFVGGVDEVRLFDRALTSAEVVKLD